MKKGRIQFVNWIRPFYCLFNFQYLTQPFSYETPAERLSSVRRSIRPLPKGGKAFGRNPIRDALNGVDRVRGLDCRDSPADLFGCHRITFYFSVYHAVPQK